MARRFGRNFENPERRIESEGDFSQTVNNNIDMNAEVDKRFAEFDGTKEPTKREKFMETIRVEPEQPKSNNPLTLAYQELDRARRSGNREETIKAEDKILDLERKEQEKEYTNRIAELKQMQREARENGDTDALRRVSQLRKTLVAEMDYDELDYKIKKLQNSQRLSPSRETLQQIMELKKELEALGQDELGK